MPPVILPAKACALFAAGCIPHFAVYEGIAFDSFSEGVNEMEYQTIINPKISTVPSTIDSDQTDSNALHFCANYVPRISL